MSFFDRLRSKPQFSKRPSEELIKVMTQIERIITNWKITVLYTGPSFDGFTGVQNGGGAPFGYTLTGNTPDGITVHLSYNYGGHDGYEYLMQGRLKGKEDGNCSVTVSPGVYNKSFCGKKEYLWTNIYLDPASFAYVRDYIVGKVRPAAQAEAAEKERRQKAAAAVAAKRARIKEQFEQEAKSKFWNR